MIEEIYINDERVRCISLGSKLTINLAEEISAQAIIRGLRAMSDFEYEFQIANINRSQNEKIESIFFTATDKFTYVSSSMVKEIALYKGRVDEFVDPVVKKELEKNLTNSGSFYKSKYFYCFALFERFLICIPCSLLPFCHKQKVLF